MMGHSLGHVSGQNPALRELMFKCINNKQIHKLRSIVGIDVGYGTKRKK